MKLLVVSICHNEAETIGEVLDLIPERIEGISKVEKLVIDDGSKDKTSEIAREHDAEVISDGAQKRLALRFREAVEFALARGADIMVNIDGDLQFNPQDIPKLVKPIVEKKADFVAADRFSHHETGESHRPQNMPLGKYVGNKLGARITGKLSNHKFNDVTCGFRAYNRDALYALNLHSDYTYTQESFQVLAMKRLRIMQIPIDVKYYPGRKSRVVRSFFHYIFSSALNILRSYRDYAPLKFFGNLGLGLFVVGTACLIFLLVHYINTGQLTPYKFIGAIGIYLDSLAFIVWVVGLMADMLDRLLGNQERIIEQLKRSRYEDKK